MFQRKRGFRSVLAVHLGLASGILMVADDVVDFLQVGRGQVAQYYILDRAYSVTVFQRFLEIVGVGKESVKHAGDIGISAADSVDYVDIAVRIFLVVLVFTGAVDDGAEGMAFRAVDDPLGGSHHGNRKVFGEAFHHFFRGAFFEEGKP